MDATIEALFIGPTFIVALLIFAKVNKGNVRANNWLGSFVLCVYLIQLGGVLYKGRYFHATPFVYDIINLVNFIVAPVFYLSVVYFIEPNKKWRLKDNLHFLFGFVMLALSILFILIQPEQMGNEDIKPTESATLLIFLLIFCMQVLLYCIAAYYKIGRYQKNLQLYASNLEKTDLAWLKKIVVCVSLITILWLTDNLFQISPKSSAFEYAVSCFYLIGVFYIAYHALRQQEIFPYSQLEKQDIETVIEKAESAQDEKRKLIPDEKLTEYRQKLLDLMQHERPHLDYEMSLIKLAALMQVPAHLLSYIINNGFNENFFQFINRYRVEEAKKMILNPEMNHLTFIGIAFEVGFNSKTVFNTTFKKITGKTPSEFKKSLN